MGEVKDDEDEASVLLKGPRGAPEAEGRSNVGVVTSDEYLVQSEVTLSLKKETYIYEHHTKTVRAIL